MLGTTLFLSWIELKSGITVEKINRGERTG
jgi:hypothetical protein